ncbi:MAG: hypothetical protein IKX05_04625 [Bacteroidales bacterium]|nr:hypothetical protein [Bacteroidales bacterium]
MKLRYILSFFVGAALLAACTAENPVASPDLAVNATPSILGVGKDGGNVTVQVNAKADWTVSSDSTWVSITPASGSAGSSTITITALANDGDERQAPVVLKSGKDSKIVTIMQEGDIHGQLENDPLTCAEAAALCAKLNSGETTGKKYYVKGVISSIIEEFGTQYGNATFWMSDDGSSNVFEVYRCLYLGNVKYSNTADQNIGEGDKVVVYGILTNYNGTPETSQNNAYLYKLSAGTDPVLSTKTPSVTVGFSETTATFEVAGKNLTGGWSVTTDADWITDYTKSGEGEGKIEVSFGANTGAERTAVFTVSAAGASDLKLTLIQAEYQENGTADKPYTVAEALEVINGLEDGKTTAADVFTKGVIVKIESVDTGSYGNATYLISDNGSTQNTIKVFRGYYLEGEKFTAEDQIAVGDVVVIKGKLQKYIEKDGSMTPEMAAKNFIYSINRPLSVSAALTAIDGMEDGKTADEQVLVKGIVTGEAGIDTSYGNATFKITEDGKAESAALTVFRAKDFENAKFTNAEAFKNGDTVVVIGQLQRYVKDGNMTPELSKGWMIAIIPAAAE